MELQEEEIAKHIEGYENYMITSLGRVWSIKRNKWLSKYLTKDGYFICVLRKNHKQKRFLIHRLIGIYFIDNPNNYNVIDHYNRDKTDNRIENLRWATTLENVRNSSKQKNTTSIYKGVDSYKHYWRSRIKVHYKSIHLGYYDTEEDAGRAYDKYILDNNLIEFFVLNFT